MGLCASAEQQPAMGSTFTSMEDDTRGGGGGGGGGGAAGGGRRQGKGRAAR